MKISEQNIWRNRVRRAVKTPVGGWVTEAAFRLRRRIFWERWMKGRALAPYSIGLWLTESCDLDCPMCWVHPDLSGRNGDDPLGKEDWFRLIDDLSEWKPRLTFTGGEPLLVPYVVELVRYAAGNGFRVNLGTNGTRLAEVAEELAVSGLQDLSVSLDGPQEVHDRIRGKEGVFDAVREGIEKVLRFRRAHNGTMPYVRVNCTLTRMNQGALCEVVAVAKQWGVDSLSFQHLWFTTPEIFRNHNDWFRKAFDQESPNLSGFMVNGEAPEPVRLSDELKKLRQIPRNQLSIYVYPKLKPSEILTFYQNPEVALKQSCRSRWFRTDVLPNGDVSPCLSFVAGNIRQDSFHGIWNSDRYRKFRRQMLDGLFPGCYRCCGLFSD